MDRIYSYHQSRFHNFTPKNISDQQQKAMQKRYSEVKSLSKRRLLPNFTSSRNLYPIPPEAYINSDNEHIDSKYFSNISKYHSKSKKSKCRREFSQSRLDYLSPISTKPKTFKKLPSLYLQKFTANLNPDTKSRYNEGLEIFKITSKIDREDFSQPKKMEKVSLLNDYNRIFNQETQTEEHAEWHTLKRPDLFHNFQLTPKNCIGFIGEVGVSKTPEPQLPKKTKKNNSQTRILLKLFEASFENVCK